MGSDGNKFSDSTGFQPSEPKLCANGCGFFGTASTMNLCSRCFRDLCVKEEQAASAKAAMQKLATQEETAVSGFSPETTLVGSSSSSAADSTALIAPAVGVEPACQAMAKVANRCSSCKKKVGVLGFQCRCGATFCGTHRYPEKHCCSFDFKGFGRDAIAKSNPVVKADKVDRF